MFIIYKYTERYKEEQLEVFMVLLSLFCDAFQLFKDKDILMFGQLMSF